MGCHEENWKGIRVILRIFSASWCTSKMFIVAAAFRNRGGYNHGERKSRVNERNFVADDLVLMSKSMENLRENVLKWKEACESKRLKFYLKKTIVMVSGSIEKIIKGKVDPDAKWGKRVIENLVLCTKCGSWVSG